MIAYRPLSEIAAPQIERLHFTARLSELAWAPLADTELLATSHHFPIAVRLDASGSVGVGALLDGRYLARKLEISTAAWRARYVPMAMRAYPFRLKPGGGGEQPRAALEVADDVEAPGSRMAIDLFEKGEGAVQQKSPSKSVKTAFAYLHRVGVGQAKLAECANQLLLCEALTELSPVLSAGEEASYWTVDIARLHRLQSRTFAALARSTFMPADIASALYFSQRLLRDGAIDHATQLGGEPVETGAGQTAIPWLVPWLDMSGLFPANFASAFSAESDRLFEDDEGPLGI